MNSFGKFANPALVVATLFVAAAAEPALAQGPANAVAKSEGATSRPSPVPHPAVRIATSPWFWGFLAFGAVAPPVLLAVAYWRRAKQDELAPEVLEALDTTAQGLMVVDSRGRIMFANRAFSTAVGEATETLRGRLASEATNQVASEDAFGGAATPASTAPGDDLELASAWVAQAETLAEQSDSKQKRSELVAMLRRLRDSRDRIRGQINELRHLANRDSLTGCHTRRAFFEEFDEQWATAQRGKAELSCLLLDIDHFREVNTKHGHPIGDAVLAGVAKIILSTVRGGDVVCRYGGEEFAILLPQTSLDTATEAGERLRLAVAAANYQGIRVTISVGAAHSAAGALDPGMLIEQADRCLYAAKRRGRNSVVRWDQLDALDELPSDRHDEADDDAMAVSSMTFELSRSVPFQAVSGLLSALAYRDPYTAAHCIRVAELAVLAARNLITAGELYFLESAALLHDIGKIGVPDSILMKPGPLADDERKLMDEHARMGAGIVEAAFSCQEISEIIRHCKRRFDGGGRPTGPQGEKIPLAARVIAAADAYDSMTNDWSYRDALSHAEAAAELKRCSGTQFDPQIVDLLLKTLQERPDLEARPAPGGINHQVLLNVGVMTERLAKAFDEHDLHAIQGYGGRLLHTAKKNELRDLEDAAQRLIELAAADGELTGMLEAMHAIMDLSRNAQRAMIAESVRPAMPKTA